MREIKFRAWDVNTNSFAPLAGIYLDKQTGASAGYIDDLGFVGEVADENPSIEQWILEQYIGLKDTNGKEIYEGDIVSIQDRDGNERVIDSVIYRTDRFALKHENVRDNFLSWITNAQANYQVVIVGNIHENPELLEGE